MPEFQEPLTTMLEIAAWSPGNRGASGRRVIAYAIVLDDYFARDVLRGMRWHMGTDGYPRTRMRGTGRAITLHQLVYAHYYGEVPPGREIDHKDRNKLNAQPNNLRAVTRSVNMMNSPKHRDNTSGYRGVYWHKQARKWAAQCSIGGRVTYLGLFVCKMEAARAVNAAYAIHYPEVSPPNSDV